MTAPTDYTDVDALSQHYADIFDFYLEERVLPPDADTSDHLLGPLTDIADDYRHMSTRDPEMAGAIRLATRTVMGDLIQEFASLDASAAGELELIDRFERASLPGKRQLWPQVKAAIEHGYSTLDVNLPGYIEQFATADREAVFAALIGDWRRACLEKIDRLRSSIVASRRAGARMAVGSMATADMEARRRVKALTRKYPVIDEIAREIGRARAGRPESFDSVIYRYMPAAVSRSGGGNEIDSVIAGADVSRLLPAELSLPDAVFDHRYVSRQLQQWDSMTDRRPRPSTESRPRPRLTRGPVIVAVDTSASMWGKPMEIAFAAVRQLVWTTSREKRPCFLISFSIRAKSIDLTSPRNRMRLDDFLNDHYTGGTSGEQMLNAALDTLNDDTFEMADVLIISDMQFDLPTAGILSRMASKQAAGTRFHALTIGHGNPHYKRVLDKIWTIQPHAT